MRIIDADALERYMDNGGWCDNCPNKAFLCSYDCDFPDNCTAGWERVIDEQPTIDAVPVRHGEWKPFDLTYGRSIYSCSVCEQATEVPMCMEKPMYAYCPNCGARMGERGDA